MPCGPRCRCKVCELTGCGAYSRRGPVKTAQSDRCKHPPCKEPEYCGYAAYCGATDPEEMVSR